MFKESNHLPNNEGVNIIVECDNCHQQCELSLLEHFDEVDVKNSLDEKGWLIVDESIRDTRLTEHMCLGCRNTTAMSNCDNCELQIHCKAWMLIAKERAAQDKKWGIQDHTDEWWLTILMEEVGELSKEILEIRALKIKSGDTSAREVNLINELIQVNAVAQAWLECKMRRGIDSCKFYIKGGETGE